MTAFIMVYMYKSIVCVFIFVASILCYTSSDAQDYNIGIRAGISQSKFIGPSEVNANESYELSGGFHFGLNFQWNFNEVIGLRSEVIYNQHGSAYSFDSEDGYYFYRPLITGLLSLDPTSSRDDWALLRDVTELDLKHSFAYMQLPQTVHFRINNRFEAFVGGYISFLLNPLATGTLMFGEGDPFDNPHIFEQGLQYNYNSDIPGGFSGVVNSRLLIVNEQNVDIPGAIGAYYFFENEEQFDPKFKSLDYGLILGFAYYLNRGFYTAIRMEYGLNDITRTAGDVSLQELNPDRTFVFNDDNDRTFGLHLSFGFKF